MAFRAATYWKTMLNRMGETRNIATSTVPKMKPFAPAIHADAAHQIKPTRGFNADFFPIYMVLGLCLTAVTFGVHTAKQQLKYNPSVHVSKKKRESLPEVEDPDYVVDEADKFLNKSFFRKVAHIQDSTPRLRDSSNGRTAFTHGREADTLKSVGVNPRAY